MTEQATTTEATTTTDTDEAPVATAIEQALVAGRKPKNKLGNCECAGWEIGTTTDRGEGEEPEVTITTTGCDKQTKRVFAQGHDAKLKSLFIRAGVEGLEVRYGRHAGVLTTTDAETAADRYGFGHQVRKAIIARLDKLVRGKKAIPAAAPSRAEIVDRMVEQVKGSEEGDEIDAPAIPEAPAEQDAWTEEEKAEQPAPATELVKGKVGRWEYEGTVAADGAFIYTSGNGEQKVADAGKWSPVA